MRGSMTIRARQINAANAGNAGANNANAKDTGGFFF